MIKKMFLILMILMTCTMSVMAFSGSGSGTSGDPYQITNWGELQEMTTDTSSYFKLMNDLDSSTSDYDTYAGPSADSGAGWTPITGFTGDFDGQNYTISDLYIYRASTYQGMYASITGAYLHDFTLDNISITGCGYLGGLVGRLYGGSTARHIVINGVIGKTGNCAYTGGLTGQTESGSLIDKCGTNIDLTAYSDAGGLVGYGFAGSVTDSYALGNVAGSNYRQGGAFGNGVTMFINNTYAKGNVTGQYRVGGEYGQTSGTSTKYNSYSIGTVSGSSNLGGHIGRAYTTTTNSFYDTNTSGYSDTLGGAQPKTTIEMMDIDTYSAWDIVAVADTNTRNTAYTWNIVDGESYPFLSWEPTEESEEGGSQIRQKLRMGKCIIRFGVGKIWM